MATAHANLNDGRDCFEWSISQKLSPSRMITSLKGVTLLTSFHAVMDPMQACVCATIEKIALPQALPTILCNHCFKSHIMPGTHH